MRRAIATLPLLAALAGGAVSWAATQQPDADIVAAVRAAIASRGIAPAEKILDEYRATSGVTADAIEALSWLARGALAARQFVKANQYAEDGYGFAVTALEGDQAGGEPRILTALGAIIETRAWVMVEQEARAEAVRFLRLELETNRDTPIQAQLQTVLDRVSLEGRPAPRVETRLRVGPPVPSVDQLKGKVVLLFFWAHWCGQCRADGPVVEKLLDKYRGQGLTIVAPTQRYGYVEGGRPAAPARELRHITHVRNTHYGFLRAEPVPISEANYKEYGVTTIPMYVLLDRQGIVRLYRPGRMTEEQLEAAIRKLL